MESLFEDFHLSFTIRDEKTNTEKTDKRKKLLKYNGLGTLKENKEKRRKELIEMYKMKRENLVNEKRHLIRDPFSENNSDEWMEWSKTTKKMTKTWINKNCKNQLMLSEWLLDRPEDLETNWTCVLCPTGQRCLVVAKNGCTRAYRKNGFLAAKFKSSLPNGAPSHIYNSELIILDCIWMATTHRLYALDVLFWGKQQLLNCDAQFRLYWLKNKLQELNPSKLPKTDKSICDLFLPRHCMFSQLNETLSEEDSSEVDGILFYHNSAPYVSGQTPLVGWLKPYMLLERFGVPVPAQYMKFQPADYTNLEQWVDTYKHLHRRKIKTQKSKEVDMDCSDSPDISETSEADSSFSYSST